LRIAEKANDPTLLLVAHYSLGGVLWHLGDNPAALSNLLEAYTRYDEKTHAVLMATYGQDFGVWILSYLEHTQLSLGYPEKGSQAIQRALALARRLGHPLSLCNAVMFSGMSSHHRREAEAARSFREETRTIAKEHGFPQYIAITSGISARREIGMYVGLPNAFNIQAEQQLAGGQVAAALESTNEALLWIEKNGDLANFPPLHEAACSRSPPRIRARVQDRPGILLRKRLATLWAGCSTRRWET
jgi:hypothetical protein